MPRLRRRVACPVELHGIGARRLQRDRLLPGLLRVRLAHLHVVLAHLVHERVTLVLAHQARGHTHRPRGIRHPDRRAGIVRLDLDRRVRARGRRTPDEERHLEAQALHLLRHVRHLLERGRDEAGEPDHVRVLLRRGLEDLLRRHHDAQVHHLEVVALEHHADDVLADVVHVALDGGHHHLALGLRIGAAEEPLLLLDVGNEVRDRLLHHARALHHLRQEHLAGAEEVADHVHAVHERALDHLDGARELLPRLLGVLDDPLRDALHQGVREALPDGGAAPREVLDRVLLLALERLREGDQALGRVGPPVEDHVLDALEEVLRDVRVDAQLPGIDDAHRHPRLGRVVQERGVHRLAHRLVAAEGEGQVGDAAGGPRMRQMAVDPGQGLEEIEPVAVVLLDAGGDREDVGIEDDVLGGEAHLLGEDRVAALADRTSCAPACRPGPSRRRP